jgi:hypothetical protein
MKLNFITSKTYNHFHFVENFSEWTEYTRKQVNSDWIAQTGPLSGTERETLKDLQGFFAKYNYGQSVGRYNNIFEFFASTKEINNPNKELLDIIGAIDCDRIMDALEVFRPRFEKIWQEHEKKFESRKQIMTDNLNEIEILKDMKRLFGNISAPSNLEVYLVISTDQYASGGANIGENRITIECSSAVAKNDIMSIFWHELSHLILKNYAISVHELTNKNKIDFGYVNEIIAHSVFGAFGLLSHKYYKAQYMINATQKLEQAIAGEIKVTEKSKEKFKFNSGQYYTAKFLEENYNNDKPINPKDLASFIDKTYTKINK